MTFREFILENETADTSRLLLSRSKYPDIDIPLAVSTIESRRKLKGKVPQWYACPDLIFPFKLSAEQCSSSATAFYKASLCSRIIEITDKYKDDSAANNACHGFSADAEANNPCGHGFSADANANNPCDHGISADAEANNPCDHGISADANANNHCDHEISADAETSNPCGHVISADAEANNVCGHGDSADTNANNHCGHGICADAEANNHCGHGFSADAEGSSSAPKGIIADLTGGLGVDSWAFSKVASRVLYNEMKPELAEAARHNFEVLGEEISVSCAEVTPAGLPEIIASGLDGATPDIIFMDPARRSSTGSKVFLLEDCQPNVLELVPEVFRICRHFVMKLSPMADISMVASRLSALGDAPGSYVREIHIVADDGECKELLVWMDREWIGEYTIIACEHPTCSLESDSSSSNKTGASCTSKGFALCVKPEDEPKQATFCFKPGEESAARALPASEDDLTRGTYLFEPGKALLKSGAFNLVSERFTLRKLGRFTHLYTFSKSATANKELEADTIQSLDSASNNGNNGNNSTDDNVQADLAALGKIFRIEAVFPLSKAGMKACAVAFPAAEVTARNIPITSDDLRKRLKVRPSDRFHIFALHLDSSDSNVLLVCSR